MVVCDDRRPLRECLETDEAEGLVGERGNEHCDGARIESEQLPWMHPAEEPDVLEPCRLAPQLVAVHPVPRDQQIRRVVPPERLDQRLDALELDQPPDEQEVRASTIRRIASRLGRVAGRQEVGQMSHRVREATRAMLLDGGTARREEEVDVREVPLAQRV